VALNGQKTKKVTSSERSEGSPQFAQGKFLEASLRFVAGRRTQKTTAEILRSAQDDTAVDFFRHCRRITSRCEGVCSSRQEDIREYGGKA